MRRIQERRSIRRMEPGTVRGRRRVHGDSGRRQGTARFRRKQQCCRKGRSGLTAGRKGFVVIERFCPCFLAIYEFPMWKTNIVAIEKLPTVHRVWCSLWSFCTAGCICVYLSSRSGQVTRKERKKKERSESPPHMAICSAISASESYHRGRKEYYGEAELNEQNSWELEEA